MLRTSDYENANKSVTVICLPLTLILKAFRMAHEHPLAGHMGENKTIETIKSFFYFPRNVQMGTCTDQRLLNMSIK